MLSKVVAIIVTLAILSVAVHAAETEVDAQCHPQCRWNCDDPMCPAKCHPVCQRPKCQIQCEETACAKCKVHCDKPQCNVRCPKDMCEKKDCPKCETVCSPANCRTSCVAPEPVCTPMCEETKCDWKCRKPTTCPKPKCELQCQKAACLARAPARPAPRQCCSCRKSKNVARSMIEATETFQNMDQFSHMMPSLIEVFHTMKQQADEGNEGCCACAN